MIEIYCDFTPDSKFILSGDKKGLIKFWEISSG